MNKYYSYFHDCSSLEEARRVYIRLAKTAHPDAGGSTKDMQDLQEAYEMYKSKNNVKMEKEDFTIDSIINDILSMNISCELVGSWIWLFNENTYQNKDKLKSMGFRFSGGKKRWYWTPNPRHVRSGSKLKMEEIRMKYGATIYKNRTIQIEED